MSTESRSIPLAPSKFKLLKPVLFLSQIKHLLLSNGNMLNLIFLSPVLLGNWTALARAGDSMSMPIHYALAVMIFVAIWLSLQVSAYAGVMMMLAYLTIMGGLRRDLIPITGYVSNDPITLIGTLVSIILIIRLSLQGRLPSDTDLIKKIRYLLVLMFIAIFNPLQGNIQVGLGGVIFYMTPLLWFMWSNVSVSRDDLLKAINIFIALSILTAFKGIYQQFVGFSDAEIFWAKVSGGTQFLSLRATRPFGFCPSFSEYVHVIVIACSLCWVNFLNRKYLYLLPFFFLFIVVFLSSSRGGVINVLLAITVLWSIQGASYRSWWPRLAIALVVALVGLFLGIEQIKEVQSDDRTADFIDHQVKGLQDPLGKQSTGGSHLSLIFGGIVAGIKTPMGFGLGMGTLSASKFSDSRNVIGTEFDISNMFVSLGVIGGGLYIVIIISLIVRLMKYWHDYRDKLVLFALGIVFNQFGNMMTGSHYLPTIFLWLTLGCMDRIIQKRRSEKNYIVA